MAEIYVVKDAEGTQLVLKALRVNYMSDADTIYRFLMEGPIIRRIHEAHPSAPIVQCIESGKEKSTGRPYHILSYVKGVPLDEVIRARGNAPLQLVETQAVILDVCGALDAIHAEGYCHQDISADNIIVSLKDGHVAGATLVDFGVAIPENSGGDRTRGLAYGKPLYMSPEHFSGDPVSRSSDLYSLGVLVYQLVVGHLPFISTTGDVLEVMEKHKSAEASLPSSVPEPIRRIIVTLLSKSPADRLLTAAEVRDAFKCISGTDEREDLVAMDGARPASVANRVGRPAPMRYSPSRSDVRPVLLGLAIAIFVGGIILAALSNQPKIGGLPGGTPISTKPTPPPGITSATSNSTLKPTIAPKPRPRHHDMVCPFCGHHYALGIVFCSVDGHRLKPDNN
jgi:serine/threonine-protein kinase